MSAEEFDRVVLDALARVELFQASWETPERFLPNLGMLFERFVTSQADVQDDPLRRWAALRQGLYGHYGASEAPWTARAEATYTAMSTAGGRVASVGDQLSAQLDVRTHANLYAALGGFDVGEIEQGRGGWWSPSAAWYRDGNFFLNTEFAPEEIPQTAEAWLTSRYPAPVLLQSGANALVRFFTLVASGARRLLSEKRQSSRRGKGEKELTLAIAAIELRARLFAEGPRSDGRYLDQEPPSSGEILEALSSQRTESDDTRSEPPQPVG